MPVRGEVYYPDKNLPPGQDIKHACVILSPNNLIGQFGRNLFVNVALIRSAFDQRGRPTRPVPGHSILITPQDLSSLTNDSYVETHQLFAVPLQQFQYKQPVGRLSQTALDLVLEGARRLFT